MTMLKSLIKMFMSALYVWTRVYFFSVRLLYWLLNAFRLRGKLPRTNEPLILMSASEAARQLRRREISSVELVEAYITRIEDVNPYLNAVVVKNYEQALELARQADAILQGYDLGDDGEVRGLDEKPFLGVPFTLKDCMMVQGLICTAGIMKRKEIRSENDAMVVARMKAAGGIQLVVTNVSEVCMWWESNNKIYGRTNNPYDRRRIVGGSSGGEAALISACGSPWGIASDIGGSIRMPAFFNGIFGLKPTPGLVPDEGCIPKTHGYQKFMHTPGPLCRYAEDLKPMLRVLAGPTITEYKLRLDEPVDFRRIKLFYMEGLRTPAAVSLDEDMRGALKKAVRFFETRYDLIGHRLDLPLAHYALEFFLTSIDCPEAPHFSQQMVNLEGNVNVWKELAQWPIGRSQHTMPALMLAALESVAPIDDERKRKLFSLRDRLIRELHELLGDNGVLVFPAFATVAPFHNEPVLTPFNFIYTALWNSLGMPVVECPMGLNDSRMPLGVQIVAAPGCDRLLIAAAMELESGFGGWHPPY